VRLLFYDTVSALEKGRAIRGAKSFAASEEYLRRHFTKRALVPGVVHVEAMAQLAGWLVMHAHDFTVSAIMSLIEGVAVPARLQPGVTLEIHAEIVSTSARDSLARAWMTHGGRTVASIDRIIYSHLRVPDPAALRDLFCYYGGLEPAALLGDGLPPPGTPAGGSGGAQGRSPAGARREADGGGPQR
jgi:3-hydroxyacyl-[acyl-carrier-protein] dehydratase